MTSGALPHLLSSFIGRQAELAAVTALLAEQRLVTLTGPGGVGKTRLAIAVAHRPVWAAAEVYLVELASLTAPALVMPAAATALGLRQQPGQAWLDGLIEWLRPRPALLLLDNCEHLRTACAHLALALLQNCPQLKILATSRERLGLAGEAAWPVPPLALPAATVPWTEAQANDAVRLFMARAQAAAPAFTLDEHNYSAAVRLCRRLDGLPLAIELAAAYVPSLSLDQIEARLEANLRLLAARDPTLPRRQQTLNAAMDWSYEGLTPAAATLFQRLSVFAGPFSLAAAEVVADAPAADAVAEDLIQLVEKSLVETLPAGSERRYRLLGTVRRYAAAKLATTPAATGVAERHAAYYLDLARLAEPHIRSKNRPVWQRQLDLAYDNLLAALAWFAAERQINAGAEMVWSLRWFLYFRGTLDEARRQAGIFLALPEAPAQTLARARLAWAAGASTWVFGDFQSAYDLTQQGLALLETAAGAPDHAAVQDVRAHLLSLFALLAQLLGVAGDHTEPALRAVALFQKMAEPWSEAFALYWLADVLRLRRDHAAARDYYEQSRQRFAQLADAWGVALTLQGLGAVAYRQGALAEGRAYLAQCLALRRASGDRWLTAQTLNTLATVLSAQGDRAAAVATFQEADDLYQALGDEYGQIYAQFQLGQLAEKRGDRPAAVGHYRRCLALAETLEHEARIAACRAALTRLADDRAQPAPPALRVIGFGPGLVYRAAGAPLAPADWGYARVRELFFFLLDQGPATKAALGLALWPEASPAQLRRNLHDALYQLRKTLGSSDWIVYQAGQYRVNERFACEYDVREYERLRAVDTAAALQQAVDLYQADFFGNGDSDWCWQRREALRRLLLTDLLRLAELYEAAGSDRSALAVYRRVLAVDEFYEAAHRRFMRCLDRLGERAQALRHYQIWVEQLQAELRAAPAPATVALYEALRRGEGGDQPDGDRPVKS